MNRRRWFNRSARMVAGFVSLLFTGLLPHMAYAQNSTPEAQQQPPSLSIPAPPTPPAPALTPTPAPPDNPLPPQPQNGLKPLTDQLRDFFSPDDNDETGDREAGPADRPEGMENDTDPDSGRGCVPNQEQLDRMMEHYLS